MSSLFLSIAILTGVGASAATDCADTARAVAARKPVDAYLRGEVLPGIVVAARSTRVSATDAGRVAQVLVAPGDEVRAGDALVRLDNVELRRELARLTPDTAVLDSQIGEQSAEVDRLVREGERRQAHPELFAREEREAHVATLDAARARLRAARSRLEAMHLRRGQLQTQLDALLIRAPNDGRVQHLRVRVGESLQPGATLAEINDEGARRVRFAVPAAALSTLRDGAPLCVRLGHDGALVDASVARVDRAFDPGAQAAFAEALIATSTLAAIAPGMAVDVLPRRTTP
jgi:RND family efflux transporter MFP subunit